MAGRTIHGTAGDDVLRGGTRDNLFYGEEGNDIAYGGGGNDTFFDALGQDVMHGGTGNDLALLGAGRNEFFGEAGDDSVFDGKGVDRIDGGDGYDVVGFGDGTEGAVVDLATGIVTDDGFGRAERLISIEGISGNSRYADHLTGSAGDNLLSASIGDVVSGLYGDDTIYIGAIADAQVDGGRGIDTIGFSGTYQTLSGQAVSATHGAAIDLARQVVGDDGFGNSATVAGFESATGSYGDDTLLGGLGANSLAGGHGADTLDGRRGDDVIRGGAGNDTLVGGKGADVFRYGAYDGGLQFDDVDRGGDNGGRDLIRDFSQAEHDRIDLSDFAAAFGPITFIGIDAPSGAKGELSYTVAGGETIVSLETDGLAGVDLSIRLADAVHLTAADFGL